MSKALDEEVRDVAVWYKRHENVGRGIEDELKFQKKVNDHLIWLLAHVAQDLQKLERRRPFGPDDGPNIVLPHGVRLHDGIRSRG